MVWVLIGTCIGGGAAALAFLGPNRNPNDPASNPKIAPVSKPSSALPAGFEATLVNNSQPQSQQPKGMVWIPGGEFSMGSDHRSESLCGLPGVTNDAVPIHRVYVDGFWMDETEVTIAQFRAFVEATSYVTVAEIKPTKEEFPTAPEENLIAGSTVFKPTQSPVEFDNYLQWWSYVPGADWRHPIRRSGWKSR
jgi:sulfatase modifying factor 1